MKSFNSSLQSQSLLSPTHSSIEFFLEGSLGAGLEEIRNIALSGDTVKWGGLPVHSSYKVMPKLQISAFPSSGVN